MNNAPQNHNCPPLMSDGRLVTDYRPSCELHYYILNKNNLKSSYDLRLFLQRNATALRNNDRLYLDHKNSCDSCNFFQPDPNGNDQYWALYRKSLGY